MHIFGNENINTSIQENLNLNLFDNSEFFNKTSINSIFI
jgi:hypothetical protein